MKFFLTGIAVLASYTLVAQPDDNGSWRRLSTMAANLLAQTDVARQAIAHKDTTAALNSIRQALALVEMMQGTAPAAEPLMVPIDTDYESVGTMVPASKHGSANRLKKNADVSEVTGEYNATILNVTVAQQHLENADAALHRGELGAADGDLTAVQGAVVKKSYTGELPLLQARDNLAIARTRVQAGDYKDTVLPLKSASRALDRFAQQHAGTHVAEQAERMRVAIDVYADGIGKDHSEALPRITAWWDQVTNWFNSGMAQ